MDLSEKNTISQIRSFTDSIPLGYAYHKVEKQADFGHKYIFLEVDKGFQDLTGLKKAQIIGRSVEQVFPGNDQDIVDWLKLYRELHNKGLDNNKEFFSRYYSKKIRASILDLDNRHFIIFFHDISLPSCEKPPELYQKLHNKAESMAHLGHYEIDLISGQAYWSAETYRIFDLDPSCTAPTIKSYTKHVHPEDLQTLFQHLEQSIQQKMPFDLVYRILNTKGQIRYVHSRADVVLNERGKPVKMFGILKDITETKTYQNALLKSEQKYRELVESSPDINYIFSTKRGTLFCSQGILEILGYQPEEMCSDPFLWHNSIQVNHRKFVADHIHKPLKKGSNFKYKIKDKQGRWHWMSDRIIAKKEKEDEIIIEGLASDITQQFLMEQNMLFTEEQLRGFIEHNRDGIIITDKKGKIAQCNPAVSHILEMDVNCFKNKFLWDLHFHLIGNDQKSWHYYYQLKKYIKGELVKEKGAGQIYPMEKKVIVNNKTKFIECYYFSVKTSKGNILASTIRDITSRKKAELAILKSEKKFHSIFDNAPIGIFQSTIEGKFKEMNLTLARMLGYESPSEAIESIKDIARDVYVDPGNRGNLLYQLDSNNEISVIENTYKRRNGDHFDSLLFIKKIEDQDTSQEYLEGMVQDLSELINIKRKLKESDERFSTIFQHDKSVKFIIDPKSKKIEEANKAATDFYGYPLATLKGMKITEINILSQPELEKELDLAISNKKNYFHFKHRLANGTIKDVEIYSTPIKLNGTTKIFSIIHDITERIRFETQLKESEQKLKELNKNKDRFFNIIAHDLKSPINQIQQLGYLLDSALSQGNMKEGQSYLNLLTKSISTQKVLLENLLDWSRSQADKIQYDPKVTDLNQLVQNVCESITPVARNKDISLKNQVSASVKVFADVNMVKTIIRNLGSNAVKFSYRGNQVIFSAKQIEQEVHLSVIDYGTGIKEEHIPKLFDIAAHFSTHGTNQEKGTGLGLILCKEMAEKNQGRIEVESTYNQGSVFTLILPVPKKDS